MFAHRLKELRKERGLTQTQFAQEFNVSNGAVGMWETGKREPDIDTINRLANFFHVSLDYLLGKSNFRNAHEMIDHWGIIGPYFEANFDFGGLVRQKREQQGLSLAEMATELGITCQDVTDCEDGVLPINRELADKMAAVLGTNVSQMLFDNDLYPEEVPEEYHDNVAEWERLCETAEAEAAQEAKKVPTQEGEHSVAQTEDEEDMLLLARHMEPIPEEDRKQLKEQFKKSIDLYLKARGLSETEDK